MIDLLNRPVLRLVLIGLVTLALQTTIFAEMTITGVALQVMLCLSVAAGVSGGSERGAFVGFLFGSLFDLVLSTPLGLTALVYGLAGFLAGYVNSLTVNHPWWLGSIVVALSTALASFVHPVVASWIGVDGWLTLRVVRIAIVTAVANAVLAPLAVPLMRWALVIKRRARLAPPPEIFT